VDRIGSMVKIEEHLPGQVVEDISLLWIGLVDQAILDTTIILLIVENLIRVIDQEENMVLAQQIQMSVVKTEHILHLVGLELLAKNKQNITLLTTEQTE